MNPRFLKTMTSCSTMPNLSNNTEVEKCILKSWLGPLLENTNRKEWHDEEMEEYTKVPCIDEALDVLSLQDNPDLIGCDAAILINTKHALRCTFGKPIGNIIMSHLLAHLSADVKASIHKQFSEHLKGLDYGISDNQSNTRP